MTYDMPPAPEIIVRRGGNMVSNFWTSEKFERAKELFLKEGKSYSVIATELGCTRNMVCGTLTRAGIFRSTPAERKERDKTRQGVVDGHKIKKIISRRAATLPTGTEITDVPATVADNPVSFIALSDKHCRWPCTGEGVDVVFCGGNALPGHSYCARHCRMAYAPPKRRAH